MLQTKKDVWASGDQKERREDASKRKCARVPRDRGFTTK